MKESEKNMEVNYEIDFVGNESSGDADAIVIRWKDSNEDYHICVYDCGTENQADKMIDLLNEYYFTEADDDEKIIDAIIISHPDGDHINGIKKIMGEYQITAMYFNIPWDYANELVDLSDNYNSASYLSSKLKKQYPKLSEIEDYGCELGIPIYNALQGTIICDELLILAPSRDDYINHLLNSDKTPVNAATESFSESDESNLDSWDRDNLLENPETSEENETSVIVWGLCGADKKRFLLMGDAGVIGIKSALDYVYDKDVRLKTQFYQVPHHGGRHNLDSDTMNRLVGNILGEGSDSHKTAYVSVGKGSNHPRQCIVNAFKRRGVKVYKTKGETIHHFVGSMPAREGWVRLTEIDFIDKYDE